MRGSFIYLLLWTSFEALSKNEQCTVHVSSAVKNAGCGSSNYMYMFSSRVFQPDNEKISECAWLTPILQDSLRHIYQRFILESDVDVLEMVYKVMYLLVCNSTYMKH